VSDPFDETVDNTGGLNLLTINDTYTTQMNELYYNPKLTQKKQEEHQYFLEKVSPKSKKKVSYKIEQNKDIDKFLSVLMQTPYGKDSQMD
jgi:hypothetical protein